MEVKDLSLAIRLLAITSRGSGVFIHNPQEKRFCVQK